MNTLPSSSLTIPPRPVRAPQKHRAGTRGLGAAPSSRSGAVRSPLVPELQANVAASDIPRPGEQALDPVTGPPEGVGEDQAPRPASLRPEMGCLEGCPVQMRLSRRRGNDLGPPHLLFLQSPGRWARTPACSGAVHGARLCRASQGGAVPAASRLCVARPWPCSLERSGAWAARGAFSPAVPTPSRRRLRGARSGRWRSCLVFRSSSQFPRLPARPLDRLQKADSPENGNEPPGHWVAPAGRPLGWAPHLSRRN